MCFWPNFLPFSAFLSFSGTFNIVDELNLLSIVSIMAYTVDNHHSLNCIFLSDFRSPLWQEGAKLLVEDEKMFGSIQ